MCKRGKLKKFIRPPPLLTFSILAYLLSLLLLHPFYINTRLGKKKEGKKREIDATARPSQLLATLLNDECGPCYPFFE